MIRISILRVLIVAGVALSLSQYPGRCVAQSAYGANRSSILDRLVNGYVSAETAKKAIEKLLAQCHKDVRHHPKDSVAHHNLGRALSLEAGYYFQVGDSDKGYDNENAAIAEQKTAIKLKRNYADAYASLGSDQQVLGNDTESLADFHKAVSLDPNCAGAYLDLGIYATTKYHDDETAMANYRKAIAADPSLGIARYNLAVTLVRQGKKNNSRNDFEAAAAEYREALRLWPFYQSADSNLVLLVVYLGDVDQEVKLEQQAITQNPNEPAVYVNLANLYGIEKQPDQAIPLLRKATQIDPECSRAYEELGPLLADNPATLQEAEADCQTVIHMMPNDADGYGALGGVYIKEKKLDNAIAQLRKAVSINPRPMYLDLLGACYMRKGNFDDALPLENEAISDDPHLAPAYINLGEILYHQGKKDEARQEWQKVLTMRNQAAVAEAQKLLDADKAANHPAPATTSTTPPAKSS